ncbi:hypothetical protein [Spirosoma litoris]
MANVRIAQIGQVRAKCPIYEFVLAGRKFVGIANLDAELEFAAPSVVRSLGISSVYTDTLDKKLSADMVVALGFSANKTIYDSRFPTAVTNLGTGLAFVPDFIPYSGWAGLNPAASVTRSY